MGTGWNVQDNWNVNLIPGIARPVVIPSGVPNFPFVNTGIFNIGDDPNNGAFRCASLWIQQGAMVTTRVNSQIENYGNIIIDGELIVKRILPNTLQNFADGTITISSTGSLIFQP